MRKDIRRLDRRGCLVYSNEKLTLFSQPHFGPISGERVVGVMWDVIIAPPGLSLRLLAESGILWRRAPLQGGDLIITIFRLVEKR